MIRQPEREIGHYLSFQCKMIFLCFFFFFLEKLSFVLSMMVKRVMQLDIKDKWTIRGGIHHTKKHMVTNLPFDFTQSTYRVSHRFRLTTQDDYFWVDFWPLLKRALFFEAAGEVVKIGLSLKLDHHRQI